jgi:hypothetical protein
MDFGLISTTIDKIDSDDFIQAEAGKLLLEWAKNKKNDKNMNFKSMERFKSIEKYVFFRHLAPSEICAPNKIPINIELLELTRSVLCIFSCDVRSRGLSNKVKSYTAKLTMLGFISVANKVFGYVPRIKKESRTNIYGKVYDCDLAILSTNKLCLALNADRIEETDELSLMFENIKIDEVVPDASNNLVVKCQNKHKIYLFKEDGIGDGDEDYIRSNRLDEMCLAFLNVMISIHKNDFPNVFKDMIDYVMTMLPMTTKKDVAMIRISSHFVCWAIHKRSDLVHWYSDAWSKLIASIFDGEDDMLEKKKTLVYNALPIDDAKITQIGITAYVQDVVRGNIRNACKKHTKHDGKTKEDNELSGLAKKLISNIMANCIIHVQEYKHIE